MPGLVDCGVVLRTALPSGNAFLTSFDQPSQGTVFFKTIKRLKFQVLRLKVKSLSPRYSEMPRHLNHFSE